MTHFLFDPETKRQPIDSNKMRNIVRPLAIVLITVFLPAVIIAQQALPESGISTKENHGNREYLTDSSSNGGQNADFLAVPVTTFPYFQDFESGIMPDEFDPQPGMEADVRVSTTAAATGSSFGLLFEGGTANGWPATPPDYTTAFSAPYATHFGTSHIDVVPDGTVGDLKLAFNFGQGYSYNPDYSWFRVLIDGMVITEINTGQYYWQPVVHWTGTQWQTLEFDLNAWAGAPFTISLQSSMKYYEDYYYEGDIALIDNLRIWYELSPGDVEGYVLNGAGQTIAGATVGIDGFGTTISTYGGYYSLTGAPGGNQVLTAWKQGYNVVNQPVFITPAGLTQQDIVLTAPTMNISPTYHSYTLNPGEYFSAFTGILNTGDGPLEWQAEVVYPPASPADDWLTLDWYEGTNPGFGFIENIPTNFDATGLVSGQEYTAEIVFTSMPDVGTTIIPCTLNVAGDSLAPPFNLIAVIIDDILCVVDLHWDYVPYPGSPLYQFFVVQRDGVTIGTTTNTYFTQTLGCTPGTYCYNVFAYYDEGLSAPAGEACVTISQPEIYVSPSFYEAWVWVDDTYVHERTINNTGNGTLLYEFPDYNTDVFACEHEIIMYDDFGDGWNDGILNLFLDGDLLIDSITLATGAGPESVFFTAETGQEITTTFSCGGWCYECSYEIYDGFGNLIASDGTGGVDPTGIGAGTAYAACPVPSYIVDVVPASGVIAPGESQDVNVYWDATGFPPGDYYEDLLLESNDMSNSPIYLGNIMHVYEPAEIAGTVIDCETGLPVPDVTVTAASWQTMTDINGEYSLFVDEGSYDIYFEKIGYETVNIIAPYVPAGVVTIVNVEICPAPYGVPWVNATVNYPDEDWCIVEWGIPAGPYELAYDDGTAEDYFVWAAPFNENAVKFTPDGYPFSVIGGCVYIGDGSYPSGNWLGSLVTFYVYDDDGTNGLPGTKLDSATVVVSNYEWLDFSFSNGESILDGEVYISMMQMDQPSNSPPIGIDMEAPTAYRSYSRMQGSNWSTSVYQDFMLRAHINGPQTDQVTDGERMIYPPKVPEGIDTEKIFSTLNNSAYVSLPGTEKSGYKKNIEGYENVSDTYFTFNVFRISDFPPGQPELGTNVLIASGITGLEYIDFEWPNLPPGWYAYCVEVDYNSGLSSYCNASNIAGADMDTELTFNVSLCDGGIPDDVEITLIGEDWPNDIYTGITDTSGTYTFNLVWKGTYTLEVFKIGYEKYISTLTISSDSLFDVPLSEKKYPPRNLWVDAMSSMAYWDEPLVMELTEDFEGSLFPPTGWQMTTNDAVGWFLTTNGSSSGFAIPTWTSQYACSNDDEDPAGSDGDGSVDYLITPPLDLREVDTYHLMFDSYYDGAYGQLAFVEYSYDAGATWEVMYALTPQAGAWTEIYVDLGSYSGLTASAPIWLAFHSDDAGTWASGWAVDNPMVANGEASPAGYHVYLDGVFVAETDTTFYQYQGLTYGVTYTSCVAALYSCGLSEEICYSFTSGFLYPPRNLDGMSQDDDAQLWWEPPLTATSYLSISDARDLQISFAPGIDRGGGDLVPDNLIGYKLYRDTENITYIPYNGEDTTYYWDPGLEPLCYEYDVTAVYDLTPYGFPGDTGESMYEGPKEICVEYGPDLPFVEDWSTGSFETNLWTAGENWSINGQTGNPEPGAEFNWDPLLMDYRSSLTSYPIDGKYHPGTQDPYLDGSIWFDFDLKLDNVNTTGEEMMIVEVWENDNWHTVATFDNAGGRFDWINGHVDITDYAFGEIFKVQFTAEGERSSDIQSWFVDNINIYRTCNEPQNLEVELVGWSTMELYWSLPEGGGSTAGGGEWIMWDDGTCVGGISLTGGGTFSVASHWDADMIADYDGDMITRIRFVPGAQVVATDFTLKVWEGPNAGTLLYEEALSGLILGDWNEINLATPVEIDGSQELWFGYTCVSADGDFPAGYDAGPAIAGYGDMITLDGVAWDPISGFGAQFNLNWNLQAYIEDMTDGSVTTLSGMDDNTEYNTPDADLIRALAPATATVEEQTTRALQGYNIFWNEDGAGYAFLDFTTDTFYTHQAASAFPTGSKQCYYITAVYSDCESVASMEACWVVMDVDDPGVSSGIQLFPNPARDILNIVANENISSITMMDYSGRIVFSRKIIDDNNFQLNVAGYETGIYLVKIETSSAVVVRKVTIAR